MTDETQTDTISIESILEAGDIPRHASIYDLKWNTDGLTVEWWTEE